MDKKIILLTIIFLVVIFGAWQIFLLFKKEKPTFTLEEVLPGTISQEISETGTVKIGEEIKLAFENAGKIEKIYVAVGDRVKNGQPLAKLETTKLSIQLNEAQAALEVAQAKLNKLLAGASPEEIKVAETKVQNAKIDLENAKQNLLDVEEQAKENLKAAYEDALNTLEDSYLKSYNALNTVISIQKSYFTGSDQESLTVKQNKEKIEKAVSSIKSYLDTAKAEPSNGNIDTALSQAEKALKEIANALRIIREISEEPIYRNVVSSTDKTSLDTHRSNINTASTNVTNSQQTISSTKLTNQTNINTAQATVSSVEGSLKVAQEEFILLTAPPRQEDIDLYQAQINQAQAQVDLLKNQIQEATLSSPTDGQITKVNKRIGETVQPFLADFVVSLLPANPPQIKVDIYEEDVVKMRVGNPVDISLAALPGQSFQGKIISINPAEKLIEGVVYYEVAIDFDALENSALIKPGMTADLIIQTASKENVLIISKKAIQKRDQKFFVEIFKAGVIEEREIKTGLFGSNDMVEVVSGLEKGEIIVLR